ncbi:DUF6263 family protein [Candidatus Ulvibacter alkanivorans]|uniref:DUF6263 family protein n=1 Tax=Candidatus Ulvibacter alkanivorans TaxID=2267620 RepID=UPI000DF411A2|nr:DUF6263 family protein [Candidatus Ulvibacter alkanivorans]
MNKSLLTLIGCFVLLATNSKAQHSLEIDLEKGTVFTIEQHSEQDILQDMDGVEHKMKNTIGGVYTFEVADVINDTYAFDVSFDSFRFKIESEIYGVLSDINTEAVAEADTMEANIFQGLLNVKFQLYVSATGKIDSLNGSEKLVDGMLAHAGIEDEAAKTFIREAMKDEFNDTSLRESLQPITYMFPKKKVKIGGEWQNRYEGEVTLTNNWKLDAYSASTFTLQGTSTLVLDTTTEGLIMKLSGTQETVAIIETSTGFMKSIEVTQNASGNTIIPAQNNAEIPTSLVGTSTFKRI